MTPYKNLSGRSGVENYSNGPDFIKVQFTHGPKVYVYTYSSAGATHIEEMKRLADNGAGLAAYIAQNTRTLFDRIE